jgi:preprotein translocase SecF subunit
MGMAVDANVLIYERIREEIDAGRPMRQAISVGFDRAYRVILDSNLTTLMTAMVLLQFTEGQVFGFALTLSIGLIANLYTGLFVSSTLCAAWFQWRSKLSLGGLRPFAASTYDFLRMCKPAWVVSVAALALCIGGVMTRGGIVLGVDFEGGVLTEVRFNAETGEGDIRAALSAGGLEGQRVQRIAGDTVDYIVRVKSLEESAAAPVEGAGPGGALKTTADRLRAALETQYGADGFTVLQTSSFGPETGQRFQSMALSVLFLAAIAILVYLWLRFELIFGVGAVVALVHDMILTLFGASLWGVEISLAEVAAMMVMLGFSVNDTIVIFDRIRENGRKITGKTFEEICNISINQSLSRTIITSGTTFLAVIAMLLIGGEGLKPFAKVLLIGSIVGTYSTMFIATPVVVAWNRRRRNKTLEALAAKAKSVGGEKVGAPAAAGARAPRQTAV